MYGIILNVEVSTKVYSYLRCLFCAFYERSLIATFGNLSFDAALVVGKAAHGNILKAVLGIRIRNRIQIRRIRKFGSPGSGSGSFTFLINVLGGLK
jgi:hypothetical protein